MRRRVRIAIGLTLLACAPRTASAQDITFAFTGVIARIDAPLDTGPFAIGQMVSGSYTFVSTVPDQNPSTVVGDYLAVTTFELSIPGASYGAMATSGSTNGLIEVLDNQDGVRDRYVVQVHAPGQIVTGNAVAGYTPSGFSIVLRDPTALAFSSDALPLAPPSLAAFSSAGLDFVFTGMLGDRLVGIDLTSLTLSGATVPLPPANLVSHLIAGNLVTLRWTPQSGGLAPTGFVVEGGLNPGEVLASLPTGGTDPTFTFTAPSGSFFVRVHALSGAVRSAASNEIPLHVNTPVAPAAPINLLGLVNASTVALAWTNSYAGGAPTSLVLDVTGGAVTSIPMGLTDTFSFAGVPAGTYTLALRAVNAAGSSPPSNSITLSFPGACSGSPLVPANLLAYRMGNTVYVDWSPATSGPAPTGYVLHVTGSFLGDLPTTGRALSGTVGAGSYTLSVSATNACGSSGTTPTQTVVVP